MKCQKILSLFTCDNSPEYLEQLLDHEVHKFCLNGNNLIRKEFVKKRHASSYRKGFSKYGAYYIVRLKYPKKNDFVERQGDLIVLKPRMNYGEKGVLLVNYNDSFEKFIMLFDFEKICNDYRIVLEPSTWGYQDIVYCLFLSVDKTKTVIIQAQDLYDYNYIKQLHSNLIPIRIGAGDWVDPEVFKPASGEKKYDAIMVASWQLLKRHRLLFRSLTRIKESISKVCLVGYASEGRTKADIIKDAKRYKLLSLLVMQENINHYEVARKLQQSRVSVVLSKREGASRVIYESLFCDVPVLLTASNRGVNRDVINNETGVLVQDEDLAQQLLRMVVNYKRFSPRRWAGKNSGYINSTRKLNDKIKRIALSQGEPWTRDIFYKKNAPNPVYVFEEERLVAEKEFENLKSYLR